MAQDEKEKINLSEVVKFGFVNSLNEDVTARTPHPEDSIFDGSAAALTALTALGGVIANPNKVTIKWDGYPALIFGRSPDGKLVVVDKYMFKKNIMATSPQQWIDYDQQKNPNNMRTDLYKKLAVMWRGLDAVVKGQGFFWGDLLWAGKPSAISGNFVFKPNTVEYRIPLQSDIGRLIASSNGGIVVHQHFSDFGGQPSLWDGEGLQNTTGGVAIINPSLGIKFTLNDPVQLSRGAASAVRKYGTAVDDLFVSIPAGTRAVLKTYFNKLITGQTTDNVQVWMKANASPTQYDSMVGDDYSGVLFSKNGEGETHESVGYTGLKAIWNSIYMYKLNLAKQLESQVQGVQQVVDGQSGGEGFVFPSQHGLFKLVNRGQFSKALFAQQKE
jgi:Family of unknown function (DUF6267)